jgi:hypothetical protein
MKHIELQNLTKDQIKFILTLDSRFSQENQEEIKKYILENKENSLFSFNSIILNYKESISKDYTINFDLLKENLNRYGEKTTRDLCKINYPRVYSFIEKYEQDSIRNDEKINEFYDFILKKQIDEAENYLLNNKDIKFDRSNIKINKNLTFLEYLLINLADNKLKIKLDFFKLIINRGYDINYCEERENYYTLTYIIEYCLSLKDDNLLNYVLSLKPSCLSIISPKSVLYEVYKLSLINYFNFNQKLLKKFFDAGAYKKDINLFYILLENKEFNLIDFIIDNNNTLNQAYFNFSVIYDLPLNILEKLIKKLKDNINQSDKNNPIFSRFQEFNEVPLLFILNNLYRINKDNILTIINLLLNNGADPNLYPEKTFYSLLSQEENIPILSDKIISNNIIDLLIKNIRGDISSYINKKNPESKFSTIEIFLKVFLSKEINQLHEHNRKIISDFINNDEFITKIINLSKKIEEKYLLNFIYNCSESKDILNNDQELNKKTTNIIKSLINNTESLDDTNKENKKNIIKLYYNELITSLKFYDLEIFNLLKNKLYYLINNKCYKECSSILYSLINDSILKPSNIDIIYDILKYYKNSGNDINELKDYYENNLLTIALMRNKKLSLDLINEYNINVENINNNNLNILFTIGDYSSNINEDNKLEILNLILSKVKNKQNFLNRRDISRDNENCIPRLLNYPKIINRLLQEKELDISDSLEKYFSKDNLYSREINEKNKKSIIELIENGSNVIFKVKEKNKNITFLQYLISKDYYDLVKKILDVNDQVFINNDNNINNYQETLFDYICAKYATIKDFKYIDLVLTEAKEKNINLKEFIIYNPSNNISIFYNFLFGGLRKEMIEHVLDNYFTKNSDFYINCKKYLAGTKIYDELDNLNKNTITAKEFEKNIQNLIENYGYDGVTYYVRKDKNTIGGNIYKQRSILYIINSSFENNLEKYELSLKTIKKFENVKNFSNLEYFLNNDNEFQLPLFKNTTKNNIEHVISILSRYTTFNDDLKNKLKEEYKIDYSKIIDLIIENYLKIYNLKIKNKNIIKIDENNYEAIVDFDLENTRLFLNLDYIKEIFKKIFVSNGDFFTITNFNKYFQYEKTFKI